MRNGLKFKELHSSDLGVTVMTKSRPIRPSVKTASVDLPHRDGTYDFSAANSMGREMYGNRAFSVQIGICAGDLSEMQEKLTRLSNWLRGSGELIFDDIPLAVWDAKVSDEIVYMPEHGGSSAMIEASLRSDPFARCIFDTENGPVLDTVTALDTALPIGIDVFYTYSVDGEGDIKIINFGDCPVRPLLKISGCSGTVTLTHGDKTLSFAASPSVTVDFDKQDVRNASGSRVEVSGSFFELSEGVNTVSVKDSSGSALTITAVFAPRFMYGVYFDEDDWSDADA